MDDSDISDLFQQYMTRSLYTRNHWTYDILRIWVAKMVHGVMLRMGQNTCALILVAKWEIRQSK